MEEINELQCIMCEEDFEDEGDRLPRMLPECGHSVCSKCISNRLDLSKPIICPEDETEQNRHELSQFPKNFSLIRMIQKRKKILTQVQQHAMMQGKLLAGSVYLEAEKNVQRLENLPAFSQSPGGQSTTAHNSSDASMSSLETERGFTGCMEHFKRQDIVCVTCRERICANCALFGKHRGHSVRSEEDVLKEISSRAETLLAMFENIEKRQCYLIDEAHIQKVKDHFQSNLTSVSEDIQQKFAEVERLIQKKKADSLEQVKERLATIEMRCIQFLQEAPKDAIEQTEKWKVEARKKLLVLCDANSAESYSLDLMMDSSARSDIIEEGAELLICIEHANANLEKQLDEFQFETVHLDFALNYKVFLEKDLITITSRQDNELSNLLHTKKSVFFQKPLSNSELHLARHSIDLFQVKIDKKASEQEINHAVKLEDTFNQFFAYFLSFSFQNHTSFCGYQQKDSPVVSNESSRKVQDGLKHIPFTQNTDSPIIIQENSRRFRVESDTSRNGKKINGEREEHFEQAIPVSALPRTAGSLMGSARKHAAAAPSSSIFTDMADDNLLNDDFNDQFNDSVILMSKNPSKIHSPEYYGKSGSSDRESLTDFVHNTSLLARNNLNEPQLLDDEDIDLFGRPSMDGHMFAEQGMSLEVARRSIGTRVNSFNEKHKQVFNEILRDTIESADFAFADMGDEGLMGMCEAIAKNKQLRVLKLQRNKISDKSAIPLLEAIICCDSALKTLHLEDNMVSDKSLDFLMDKLFQFSLSPKKEGQRSTENQMPSLAAIYLKNNLLNINKATRIAEELAKVNVTLFL